MKQLIKSAIVYKADFGVSIDALQPLLEAHAFTECQPNQMRSVGFVPVTAEAQDEYSTLTTAFRQGFGFRVRIDQKQIPNQVVKQRVDACVASILKNEGRKTGKKERAEIKDDVMLELAAQAFPRTAVITCFYNQETGYLVIPSTSQKLADCITSALVQAAGSVKTETIHISSVKHGLTKRLKDWAEGNEDAFGVFHPCAEAALQQDKRKINIKMGDLQAANSGIKEAMGTGFEVTSLGLTHDGETEFRLTSDFRLKGIQFSHTDAEDDEEVSFYAQATLEVAAVTAVITDLIGMIGHGEPQQEQEVA